MQIYGMDLLQKLKKEVELKQSHTKIMYLMTGVTKLEEIQMKSKDQLELI